MYFDEIKALSFRQNGKGKFNLTNFILLNLIWQTLLAGHFYFFNFVYYGQTEPCLGSFHLIQDLRMEWSMDRRMASFREV